jgi:predicted PolB exonuclease-like 3'-5' exonuclease
MHNELIIDIETFPIDDAEQYLPPVEELSPPDLASIQPAKNLVDPLKIAADIGKRHESALRAHEQAVIDQARKRQELIDGCAVDPDLLRIVCIGMMYPFDERPVIYTCKDVYEERIALERVWQQYDMSKPKLVTFSGLRFDLPALMRRSLYLNVRYPRLNLDRYRTPHIDLQAYLSENGVLKWHSLDFYLARFGIRHDDVTTGKDIAAMVRADDWDGIKAHCEADVIGTRDLARRCGLLTLTPQPETEQVF